MFTRAGCQARRKRLWDALPDKPDIILVSDPQHLFYFTNYAQSPFVFRSNDAGAVLVMKSTGEAILIGDSMAKGFLDAAYVDEVIAPTWYDGQTSAPHREALLIHSVLLYLKKLTFKRVGIELAQVPSGLMHGLDSSIDWLNIDPVLPALKRQKDAEEVALLKRSMLAGEAGMAAGLRDIKPGMSELEIFFLVQNAAMTASQGQVIVYGDFVTGPRTEKVGGPPTDRKVQSGELVLLDFSTIIGQYRADFANTHVCAGKPTPRQREMFQACMEAMEAGEKLLKPGTPARDVDLAVRQVFASKHLLDHFPHHTGHGIGLGRGIL